MSAYITAERYFPIKDVNTFLTLLHTELVNLTLLNSRFAVMEYNDTGKAILLLAMQ